MNFLSNPEQFSTAGLHHTGRVGCASDDSLATMILGSNDPGWTVHRSQAQENAMQFHLTSPQLLLGAFALTLGIIFALATVVQLRLQRARPFRNYYCTEVDPSHSTHSTNESFSQAEDIPADERSVFADFGIRYSHSPTSRANAQNNKQFERE
ncbi:MAG TPA: hypothetical protein VMQ56_05165 [Terracidiphilus sp.]|jgi:hypothetical protein|nr:hypothetical protein [Terracidiphilus sp.]